MKGFFSILILVLFVAANSFAQQKKTIAEDSLKVIPDTSLQAVKAEETIIDEIVETRAVPPKDRVQYFSKLTRYGFKNLFPSYSYNAAMPYSSQVNPNAEAYMQDYLRGHSKSLVQMKPRAMPYFNLIDNIFTQYGLPKELKYLAVIESNLSAAATSSVGAGGPWQFMPYTARDFGLTVNGMYDERRDYFKSTHAAARYLLTLYKQMHDWLLVIAAYNGGPGRVYSAISKSGSRNFWALQYYLPEESRNHVKKFIATHYIMEGEGSNNSFSVSEGMSAYTGSMGAGASNPYSNKPTLSVAERELAETQNISGKFNSVVIAKNITMDIAQFNRYNPQFDMLLNSNGQFELILPADKMQLFMANKYQILNECVQLLLGDNDIPNNKTVYPAKYNRGRKKS